MKAFADQRKAKPVFRRHAPAGRVDQARRPCTAQRVQVREILDPSRPQFKLTIGAPNDVYEQEADRVADQVMRMPEPTPSGARVQRRCPECEEGIRRQPLEDEGNIIQTKPNESLLQRQPSEEEDEEELQTKALNGMVQRQAEVEDVDEETLQTKAAPGHSPTVGATTHAKIQSLKGGGQPLPPNQRTFYESRMGHDFSGVRIHADSKAADTARSINAKAFTLGQDVVFGAGEYAPGAHNGRKLLAHELTHVVQQNGGDSENLKIAPKSVKRVHSLLGMTQKSQSKTPDIQRWLSSEHTAIGDESYKAFSYFRKTTLTSDKFNVSGVDLTYGKLTAMADFFDKYAGMLSGKKKNLAELSRLVDLEGILGVEHTSKSITMNLLYQAATEGRYVRLALRNFDHFTFPKGPEIKTPANVNIWKGYHKRALNKVDKARKLNSKGKGGEAIKRLSEAMSVNAYGDHFISDAFASGHLITRRQLIYWPSKARDIHDHYNKYGLEVVNKKNEKWFAWGDKYYADPKNAANKKRVIDTVKSSIADVIKLWKGTGKTAPPFDAEDMVPIDRSDKEKERKLYPGEASVWLEFARLVAKDPKIGPAIEVMVDVKGHASVDNMIRKWISQASNARLKALGSEEKAILMRYLLKGPTLDADEMAINTLLRNSRPWDAVLTIKKIGYKRIASDIHGAEYGQFLQILVKQYAKTNRGQTKMIVEHWLRGGTGDREENAIVDLLRELSPVDVNHIISKIGFEKFDDNIHGDEYERFMGVIINKYSQLPKARKIYIIKALSQGRTTEDEEEAIVGVLEAAHKAGEFCAIVSAVGKGRLYSELTGAEEDRFEELLKFC